MRSKTSCSLALLSSLTLFAGVAPAAPAAAAASPAEHCANAPEVGFGQALVCYHDAIEQQPLTYTRVGTSSVAGVERRDYLLTSQDWSPEDWSRQRAGSTTWRSTCRKRPCPRAQC